MVEPMNYYDGLAEHAAPKRRKKKIRNQTNQNERGRTCCLLRCGDLYDVFLRSSWTLHENIRRKNELAAEIWHSNAMVHVFTNEMVLKSRWKTMATQENERESSSCSSRARNFSDNEILRCDSSHMMQCKPLDCGTWEAEEDQLKSLELLGIIWNGRGNLSG
jgi:hypothetical protein